MGLVMSPASVIGQLSSMNGQLNTLITNIQTMKDAVNGFLNTDDTLVGESYEELRTYYEDVHVPLLDLLSDYAGELLGENNAYSNCISSYLGGVNYIDEDGLREDKRKLEQIINRTQNYEFVSSETVACLVESLYRAMGLIDEKLKQIEGFLNASSGLYQGMASYQSALEAKMPYLKNYDLSLRYNSYMLNGLLESRGASMWDQAVWDEFAKCLESEFGFDEETIGIMEEVYKQLRIKYPNETQEEIDWRFTRLMGGLVYDKGMNHFLWDDTAGSVIDRGKVEINGKTVLMNEEIYFTHVLGISYSDYKKLRYEVRLQHTLSGAEATWRLKDNYEDLATEQQVFFDEKLDDARREGLRFDTNQEFLDFWNIHYDRYSGKGDFAHQQIATSAILATGLNKDGSASNLGVFLVTGAHISDEHKTEAAGWLGDAVIGEKTKTLGPGDYKADLDAENITALMENEGLSYQEATMKYYSMLNSGISRAALFLEENELSYVIDTIYYGLKKPLYNQPEASDTVMYPEVVLEIAVPFEEKLNYIQEHSSAGYNFIKNLERGANEMEVYD